MKLLFVGFSNYWGHYTDWTLGKQVSWRFTCYDYSDEQEYGKCDIAGENTDVLDEETHSQSHRHTEYL